MLFVCLLARDAVSRKRPLSSDTVSVTVSVNSTLEPIDNVRDMQRGEALFLPACLLQAVFCTVLSGSRNALLVIKLV